MGFKSKQKNKTFSDLEKSSDRKNKALVTLMELDKAISWDKIEAALLRDYPVGQKKEGNKAYPPLFLFKCLLLGNRRQKTSQNQGLKTSRHEVWA